MTTTETAKLLRAELKAAFPRARFSLHATGGALTVVWVDGPSREEVRAVTDKFGDVSLHRAQIRSVETSTSRITAHH